MIFGPVRSLKHTVPLYIGLGLTVLFAAWTAVSYRSVRNAALAVGNQRLTTVTDQLETVYDSAVRAYVRGIRTAAASPVVVGFVASGGTSMRDSLGKLLARSANGSNRRVELFALDGTPLATFPESPGNVSRERHEELTNVFSDVVKGPTYAAVAPLRLMDDSVVAPVVAAVLRDSQPVGYMVLWRRPISNNVQARDQISNLIGANARLYLGNQRGDLWADASGEVVQLPSEMSADAKSVEYHRPDGRPVMGKGRKISGSPWSVGIEFDSGSVLEPAAQFLRRSILVGLLVLVLGTVTASLLSRRITSPLHELTAAATAVASGDYTRAVTIGRKDELGQLSMAFNAMAARVGESQQALEDKVRERTEEIRERNEELEAFAHSISHDLRAPLRAMHGFSQALLEDHADQLDDGGKDYARRIAAAAHRMDNLTRDLLDYSRVSRSELTIAPVDLGAVARNALALLEADVATRHAAVEIREPMLSAMGHQPLVEQVVTNLIANALKFVPGGTTPEIVIRTERNGRTVRLWVEDNGIGIDPAYHQRIFSVFERLHSNEQFAGTGIGLAIVRKAIERMGGNAGVESNLGFGSRFWIELRANVD